MNVEIIMKCGCGLAYTLAEWNTRPLAGTMDDGLGGVLELRQCRCGSHRSRQLSVGDSVTDKGARMGVGS